MRRAFRSAFLWTRGWTVFLFGAPAVVLFSYVLSRQALQRLVRRWCRLTLGALGIRVIVCGEFPPASAGPMVVIAPHVNLFDPLVLGSILPRPMAGIELETHFRWPVYGAIIRRLRHVAISHASPHRSCAALLEAIRRLRRGESLVIFPEGHRTRTGRRGPFGLWAFRLAARAGAPIVPTAFSGAWERHHLGSWHIVPGLWRVLVLPPIWPARPDRTGALALRAAAESVVK